MESGEVGGGQEGRVPRTLPRSSSGGGKRGFRTYIHGFSRGRWASVGSVTVTEMGEAVRHPWKLGGRWVNRLVPRMGTDERVSMPRDLGAG